MLTEYSWDMTGYAPKYKPLLGEERITLVEAERLSRVCSTVHQATKESSCGEHYPTALNLHAHSRFNAPYSDSTE